MDRQLRFLESFPAQGTDGARYKVRGYEHLLQDPTLADGQAHWQSTGLIEYRLDDGTRVEVVQDGSMRISGTDVVLTRQ